MTLGAFELRGALPGVGEALKREIAGLGLAFRLRLWGIEAVEFCGSWLAGWSTALFQ